MKDLSKNKSGITLIALVITIIVLLILAAVSLSLVAGSEGILNRAANAVDQTNTASFNEKMQLKLTEIKANYYDAKYVNRPTGATPRVDTFAHYLEDILAEGNIDIDGNAITFVGEEDGVITIQVGTKQFIIDENGNVAKQLPGIVTGAVSITDDEGTAVAKNALEPGDANVYIHFTASLLGSSDLSVTCDKTTESLTLENGECIAEVSSNGTYTFTLTGTTDGQRKNATVIATVNQYDALAAMKFGDYFDLGTNLLDKTNVKLEGNETMLTDWRIFNRDNDGVWLILADYLPINGSEMNTFITGTGENQIGLVTKTGVDLTTYPYSVWSNTSRADLMDRLALNSTYSANWKGLLPSGLQSNSNITAVGALTVSQWTASWNEKHASDAITLSNYGTEGSAYSNIYLNSTTSYTNGDTLYFPHKSAQSKCSGYWLASPNASGTGRVMLVGYDGNVRDSSYNNNTNGVRPAVHLGSGINIEENENGIWRIAE